MLTRPAGHEAKARKSEDEAEAQKNSRGRGHNVWRRGHADTLQNNSVCMSMKTKILALRK